MTEWLTRCLAAAIVAVSGGTADRTDATPEPAPTTTTVPAEEWTDPTTGVTMAVDWWQAPTETYPSGDYWNDVCIPTPRLGPNVGTTQVGGMLCTPD